MLLLADASGTLRIRAAHGADPELVRNFSGQMNEDVIRRLRSALKIGAGETLVSVPVIAKAVVDRNAGHCTGTAA